MKRVIIATLIGVLGIGLASATHKFQNSSQAFHQELLDRRLGIEDMDTETTVNVFVKALRSTETPGGIAIVPSCGETVRANFDLSKPTLQGALESIVASNPQYRWEVQGGAVNLLPYGGTHPFLETPITRYEVKGAETLDQALNTLLALPEVQKRENDLNLGGRLVRGRLGYFDPNDDVRKESKKFSVKAKKASLREVLNAIAQAHGSGVWVYSEYRCGSNAYELEFLAQ